MADSGYTKLLKYPDFLVEESQSFPPVNSDDLKVFKLILYVRQFYPEEISIKVNGVNLVVHGKHKEHVDLHGFITREFKNIYVIPDDYEPKSVSAVFLHGGVLKIFAYKKDHWMQFLSVDRYFQEYINLQPFVFRSFDFKVEDGKIVFTATIKGNQLSEKKDIKVEEKYYLPLDVDPNSVITRLTTSQMLEIRGEGTSK